MTPEILDVWIARGRDILIALLATFMLVYETVLAREPNPYLIGAGLTLLGIPPALRLDRRRQGRPDNPLDPREQ